jgi:hypothetical protein
VGIASACPVPCQVQGLPHAGIAGFEINTSLFTPDGSRFVRIEGMVDRRKAGGVRGPYLPGQVNPSTPRPEGWDLVLGLSGSTEFAEISGRRLRAC